MGDVDIFGTYHIDRPKKVKEELSVFCDGTDVFFVEAAREEATVDHERALLLRNPVLWITAWLVGLAWGLPGLALTGRLGPVDCYVTDVVAREQNINIEPVDMSLVRRASKVGLWVSATSWILLLLAIFLFGLGVALLSSDLIIWAVVVALAPVVPFAYRTLPERDETIAENIVEILDNDDSVQRGCLVVGRKHMSGVKDELEGRGVVVGKTHDPKFFCRSRSSDKVAEHY